MTIRMTEAMPNFQAAHVSELSVRRNRGSVRDAHGHVLAGAQVAFGEFYELQHSVTSATNDDNQLYRPLRRR